MKDRYYYFDYLRILAILGVIVIHITAATYNFSDINSFDWHFANVFNSVSRFAVPTFCCLSGALFLDPDKKIDIKQLYTKNLFRIIIAFVFWGSIYAIYNTRVIQDGFNLYKFISALINGGVHLWFLYMIAGIYMVVPILRVITADKKIMEYYLIVSFVFNFLLTTIAKLPIPLVEHIGTIVNEKLLMYTIMGYAPYFVLGHYLTKYDIPRNKRIIIYILGVIGAALSIILNVVITYRQGKPSEIFGYYNTVNVLFETIGLFVFAKYVLSKINLNDKSKKILFTLSKLTFGVYLCQPMVSNLLKSFNIVIASFDVIPGFIIVFILTTVLSFVISYILNKIPFLNKYIV